MTETPLWKLWAAQERWLSSGVEIGKCRYTLATTGGLEPVQKAYLAAKCRDWFVPVPGDDQSLLSSVTRRHAELKPNGVA